jgi:LuxR family transcriptional regulator, quorum-sensing system regulator SolR
MKINLKRNHFIISSAGDIAEILKPLLPFGIEMFSFLKIHTDNSRTYLSNSAPWIKDYYELELYESSLFEDNKAEYLSGFILWPEKADTPVFKHGRDVYNSHYGFTYYQKINDIREFYFFSGSKKGLEHFFINNPELIKKFILYFKDKARHLLIKAEKNKILLPNDFKPLLSFLPNYILCQERDFKKMEMYKKDFHEMIKVSRYFFEEGLLNGVGLSPREIECLLHLLSFQTSKEIASIMNLSSRTIETYIDNVKSKLHVHSKSELVAILKKYNFNALLS